MGDGRFGCLFSAFDDTDFLVAQFIQRVDQPVDLAVGRYSPRCCQNRMESLYFPSSQYLYLGLVSQSIFKDCYGKGSAMLKAQRVTFTELSERLKSYEQKYGYSTVDFFRRYQDGKFGDDDDLMMWAGVYHLYLTSLPIRQFMQSELMAA